MSEFAGPSPIEFDLALEPRRVFSSALRCSAPQRLELVVALLEILEFGDGGTNAEGRPHVDLTRIGRGAGLAASIQSNSCIFGIFNLYEQMVASHPQRLRCANRPERPPLESPVNRFKQR